MLNSLTGARLQNDSAIALLLWHAGVSVNMIYSASGSGAYSEDARNSLVNNFRFSSNASYIQRDDYQPEVWDSLIRSCLDVRCHCIMTAMEPAGMPLTAMVPGKQLLHFNWGWSGTANGYYYLDNLNPDGDNFFQQEKAHYQPLPGYRYNTYPYPCNSNIC